MSFGLWCGSVAVSYIPIPSLIHVRMSLFSNLFSGVVVFFMVTSHHHVFTLVEVFLITKYVFKIEIVDSISYIINFSLLSFF